MLKKILENLGMAKKKTAKKAAVKKTAKKTVKKTTAKKAPAKKAAGKKTAKKVAAKKTAAKKTAKKVAAKKTAKKVVAKKAAKKVAAKKTTAKKKVVAKKKTATKVAKKTAAKVAKKAAAKKDTKAAVKAAKPAVEKKTKTKAVKAEPKKGKGKKKADEEDVDSKAASNDDEDEDEDDKKKGSGSLGFDDNFKFDDDFQLSAKDEKKLITDVKEALADQVVELAEDYSLKDIFTSIRSMEFFEAENDECLERGCDNPTTTGAFCRFHYIKNWKEIKKKQELLREGKLQVFIEELVTKYPPKYVENILSDLVDEKSFLGVLKELNIDGLDEYDDGSEDDDGDDDIAFETKTTKGFDED